MNATDSNPISNFTDINSPLTHKNRSWRNEFQNETSMSSREIFIICCYSVIVVISIFGNLLVCSIVVRNRNMRSATYVFITNLALSDLMMTVLNIPFNVARLLLNNWPFGRFMCSFVPLMQVTSVYVSTFTMMCIAVDRYRHVIRPFRPRVKPLNAVKIMIGVWLLSVVLSVPHAVFNRIDSVFTYRTLVRCRTVYPYNASRWITLTTVGTQYALPLTVTGVLYCLIMARVWSRHVLGVVTEAQIISQARSKRRTIKMLMFVVILFALCWLPLNLFHLLHEFNATHFIYRSSMPSTVFFACHWLAMSSVCYNPFIYCWLNEKFRSGAAACLLCLANMVRKISLSLRSTGGRTTRSSAVEMSSHPCHRHWNGSSKMVTRKAMVMPMKCYAPNSSEEKGEIVLMKIRFYSVPDFSELEQSKKFQFDKSSCKCVKLDDNGKAEYRLRRCFSWQHI